MELKVYQNQVLRDLESYIDQLLLTKNPSNAYFQYWKNKGVRVGFDGMKPYKELIPGVPSVCLKVPTGGGKTLLGCSCLKRIFDRMSSGKKKAVVWLVPWDTILTQTYDNLSNPSHFYHQQLVRDFSGRVEIYNKKQLMTGQNFNVSSVSEQLSIFVLSFDTFRSSKKENRKVYETNPNLTQFTAIYDDRGSLVSGVEEDALIQVLNQLNPVVIIDESHNAKSDLSVEMIKNLNPSFVVELTATPKDNSNIISIVPAESLKKEHMVKLPVIAYNRPTIERVIVEAIDLQHVLESHAIALYNKEPEETRKYIRPIVLFQAQPKSDKDNVTFDKIKQNLIDSGIPAEQIAIKTANKNEIADVDLMSPNCPIRYIITINALKEGWDCPFAYILASLANKTSKVDVEQILGRILRQPHQREYADKILNMSYVLSCSNDFNETLKRIVAGLNSAGFSKNDCRVISEKEETQTQTTITHTTIFDSPTTDNNDVAEVDDTIFNIDYISQEIKKSLISSTYTKTDSQSVSVSDNSNVTTSGNENISQMLDDAISQSDEYDTQIENANREGLSGVAPELTEHMNNFKMNTTYTDFISTIKIPQFFHKVDGGLFDDDNESLINKDDLTDGFKLSDISLPRDLISSTDNVYKIDVITNDDGSYAKQYALGKNDSEEFKKYLQLIPETSRINACKNQIITDLNKKFNCVGYNDLVNYIGRIFDGMKEDELAEVQSNIMSVSYKIKNHIENEIEEYRILHFKELLETDSIYIKDSYEFPKIIHPNSNMSFYPQSLYNEEDDNLTDVETAFISKVSSLDNVLCWHRIIERKGFCINGFINHYPDFIVFTKKGKIILVETKGEHLANDDSKKKLELGKIWENKAGSSKYRYYMAFLKNPMNAEGSYQVDKLVEIIRNL